jgi:hypothetical protein
LRTRASGAGSVPEAPASIRAGARHMASCAWPTLGVIANTDAITHDARTIGAIFFMCEIMTTKPGPDKPLILTIATMKEVPRSSQPLWAPRLRRGLARGASRRFRFSLMTATRSSADSTASPIGDGAISVIFGSSKVFGVGASDAGYWRMPRCKPVRGSASAFTLIHSIRAQHNSMSIAAFCVLVRSMIFHPGTREPFCTKSCLLAEAARRDR